MKIKRVVTLMLIVMISLSQGVLASAQMLQNEVRGICEKVSIGP